MTWDPDEFLRTISGETKVYFDEEYVIETLLAETIRIGLWTIYTGQNIPITSSSLVNWVTRKLEILWEAWFEGERDLRREVWGVLRETRAGSMDFLGDVLILKHGRCLPSPTRLIEINEENKALVSGAPTSYLKDLVDADFHLSGASRVITGMSRSSLEFPTQEVTSFLGADLFTTDKDDLVSGYLKEMMTRLDWTPATIHPAWHGLSRFSTIVGAGSWTQKPKPLSFNGWTIELYRERLFNDRFFRYWLIRSKTQTRPHDREGLELTPVEVFRLAVILARLSGNPATLICSKRDITRGGAGTRVPAVALRLIYVLGGKYDGISEGIAWWSLPSRVVETVCSACERLGFAISHGGEQT